MKNKAQKRIKKITSDAGKIKLRIKAFTMVELLIAIMISSIILTAIVTFSYAMSSAYDYSSDINEKEAYIRYTTMRIKNLIKYSKLICRVKSDEILIWKNDDNNDNRINASELLYIETGEGTYLRLLEFDPDNSIQDFEVSLFSAQYSFFLKLNIFNRYPESNRIYTNLIRECSNVSIKATPNPPYTQCISISFDIEENEQTRKYQINTALHCQRSNFINNRGFLIKEDDDLY